MVFGADLLECRQQRACGVLGHSDSRNIVVHGHGEHDGATAADALLEDVHVVDLPLEDLDPARLDRLWNMDLSLASFRQ